MVMPIKHSICDKCGGDFRKYIVVNGKKKNLWGRKYCLECYPLGQYPRKHGTFRKCIDCGKIYQYIYEKGHRKNRCNTCSLNLSNMRRKQKCIDYKGGKCVICGYCRSIRSLCFHHLNQAGKNFTISQHRQRNWEDVKKELDKCILVCANCHGEIHDGIILGW